MTINKGLFSSNTSEWETPTAFFKALDAEFHFTLDPCATHENAKCKRYYTIEDDGLTQNWGGRESFATLRMVAKSRIGSRSATWSPEPQTLSLLCSFLQGQTPRISMISSTGRRRFDSSGGGYTSTTPRQVRPSRVWL